MDNLTIEDQEGSERIRWRCPLCSHHWDFHQKDVEHREFLAVYHLANKHQLCGSKILELLPELHQAVNEYPGQLPPEPQ